jgi:hypothetical protein
MTETLGRRLVVALLALVITGACSGDINPIAPSAPASLHIATSELPNGVRGQEYGFRFEARNGQGPYNWSLSGNLPFDLSFENDGRLLGLAREYGRWSFRVKTTDSAGQSDEKAFDLRVLCENEHFWTADGLAYAKILRKIPTCGDPLKVDAVPDISIEYWQDKWPTATFYVGASQNRETLFTDHSVFSVLGVRDLVRGTKATSSTAGFFPGPDRRSAPVVGWIVIWMIDVRMINFCRPSERMWLCQGADLLGFVELNYPLIE